MSENTIHSLVDTRKRVVMEVNQGVLSAGTGVRILGLSRQGLWKMRKKVEEHGMDAITGLKRGPKVYQWFL